MTIIAENKRWCVYTHSTAGAIFYVGVGSPERPLSRRKSHRNPLWTAYIVGLERYDVDIRLWTNDRKEALRVEAEIIKDLRPVCNQLLNGYTNPERNRRVGDVMRGKAVSEKTRFQIGETRRARKLGGRVGSVVSEATKQKLRETRNCTAVRCNETGVEYPSLTVASAALKIQKSSLRAHIHGRTGHVSGFTFTILRVGRERSPPVVEIPVL